LKNRENQENKIKRKYLNRWIDYVNLYGRPNDAATMIQTNYRAYLARKLRKNLEDRINKLRLIIERMLNSDDDILRAAVHKWNNKTKQMECNENAKIIQDFCRKVYDKLIKKKDRDKNTKYLKGFEKILDIRPKVDDVLNKLRRVGIWDIFDRLDDILDRNKTNNLRNTLIKVTKFKNLNKLRPLINIYNNTRDNLLRKYLNKWKDIIDSMNDDDDKVDRRNELIKLIVSRYNDDVLPSAFFKWLNITKRDINNENAKIIQDFCRKYWPDKNKRIKKGLDLLFDLRPKVDFTKFKKIIEITNKFTEGTKRLPKLYPRPLFKFVIKKTSEGVKKLPILRPRPLFRFVIKRTKQGIKKLPILIPRPLLCIHI